MLDPAFTCLSKTSLFKGTPGFWAKSFNVFMRQKKAKVQAGNQPNDLSYTKMTRVGTKFMTWSERARASLQTLGYKWKIFYKTTHK